MVGSPDPVRTEVVKAFILPRPGIAPIDGAGRAKSRPSCASGWPPTSIRARSSSSRELPMTATGKIRRKDLRDQEVARKRGASDPG